MGCLFYNLMFVNLMGIPFLLVLLRSVLVYNIIQEGGIDIFLYIKKIYKIFSCCCLCCEVSPQHRGNAEFLHLHFNNNILSKQQQQIEATPNRTGGNTEPIFKKY